MAERVDFDKDDATQSLLALAGIHEPYEDVIERACLSILKKSVPECDIERIRYVRSAGSHPRFCAGGTKDPDDPDLITLQELLLPFDLELHVRAGPQRHVLRTTFLFDCSKMDDTPATEFRLEIHSQTGAGPEGTGAAT